MRLLTATLLVKLAREVPTALLLAHGQNELCAFAETAMATGDTVALGAGLEVLSTVQATLAHAANVAMADGDCATTGEGAAAGEGGGKAVKMLVTTHRTRTLLRTLRADRSVNEAVRGQAKRLYHAAALTTVTVLIMAPFAWQAKRLQHATRHGKHAAKEDKQNKEVSVSGWRDDLAASAPAVPPPACEEEGTTARDAGDAHLEMAADVILEMKSWEMHSEEMHSGEMHPKEMYSEEMHSDKMPRPEEEEEVRPEAATASTKDLRVTTDSSSTAYEAAHRRLPTSPITEAPQPQPDEVRPPKLLSTCTLHLHVHVHVHVHLHVHYTYIVRCRS